MLFRVFINSLYEPRAQQNEIVNPGGNFTKYTIGFLINDTKLRHPNNTLQSRIFFDHISNTYSFKMYINKKFKFKDNCKIKQIFKIKLQNMFQYLLSKHVDVDYIATR